MARWRAYIISILKELQVPLVDPCDPSYQGLPCEGSVPTIGQCISESFCVGTLDFNTLIQGKTPDGPFGNGVVATTITITNIANGESKIDRIGGELEVGTPYPLSLFSEVDLSSISQDNQIEWTYNMTYTTPNSLISYIGGSCTVDVINDSNAGQDGEAVVC